MELVTKFVEVKLKLLANRDTSAIDRPWEREVPLIQFSLQQGGDDSPSPEYVGALLGTGQGDHIQISALVHGTIQELN